MSNNEDTENKSGLYWIIGIVIITGIFIYDDKLQENNLKKELSQCILQYTLPKGIDYTNACRLGYHTQHCTEYISYLDNVDTAIENCSNNYQYGPINNCIYGSSYTESLLYWSNPAKNIDNLSNKLKNCVYFN